MEPHIRIYCKNDGRYYSVAPGTSVAGLLRETGFSGKYPVLAAYVDNKLKQLDFPLFMPHSVEFIDISYPDGRRTYVRSLSLLLQKVVYEMFPGYELLLDYALPRGLYGELRERRPLPEESGTDRPEPGADSPLPRTVDLTPAQVAAVKDRMQALIRADLPFRKCKVPNQEAADLFLSHGQRDKARLHKFIGNFFVSVYYLDGYGDSFYGPLLPSTACIDKFDLFKYDRGFCLQSPDTQPPYDMPRVVYQEKLHDIFKESSDWYTILGAKNLVTVNEVFSRGLAPRAIQIAEALHERKYAAIADRIHARRDRVRLVLISGPSSSGKTTTSKRIALQLKIVGLNPVVIAMDNYFRNREDTPRDENGQYDFECLGAMDLELLNDQINRLFNGEEVELPKFDFVEGKRYFDGERIRLQASDVLVMEGIHALNPALTAGIDDSRKFKIYASALTSLSIDENNSISTTDNRLLRRIVRDNNFRGASAEETILRWASVRAGEYRNIFPYQENADIMFNSFLIYELPLLKHYAEPLLRRITPASAAYAESLRLLKFLSYIVELDPVSQQGIPPTSVMREFIGGSTFVY